MFDFLQWLVGAAALSQVIAFLTNEPATWIAAGCLLGILTFLVNVGPLKRIQPNGFVGKLLMVTLCAGFLFGLAWLGLASATETLRSWDRHRIGSRGHELWVPPNAPPAG